MSLDSGLTDDRCVYIRANSGDTGASPTGERATYSVWWLSPDIRLNGGSDLARAGMPNTIDVSFTLKGNCPLHSDANKRVKVELWVGTPSLAMGPSANTYFIDDSVVNTGIPSNSDRSFATSFAWTLPSPLPMNPNDPQAEGHKCLVARVYPRHLTASSSSFFCVNDPHYAQRNICVVRCSSPCGQEITTANIFEEVDRIQILAVADLKPTEHVLSTVYEELRMSQKVEFLPPDLEFRQAQYVPPFAIELFKHPEAKVRDYTRRASKKGFYGRRKAPNYNIYAELQPQEVATLKFETDLEKLEPGEFNIIHLMHISGNKEVLGGLTLISVKVE